MNVKFVLFMVVKSFSCEHKRSEKSHRIHCPDVTLQCHPRDCQTLQAETSIQMLKGFKVNLHKPEKDWVSVHLSGLSRTKLTDLWPSTTEQNWTRM